MGVALEVVAALFHGRHLERLLDGAVLQRGGGQGVAALLGEDVDVVRDARVLVVQVDLEVLTGGGHQARRIEEAGLGDEVEHDVAVGTAL